MSANSDSDRSRRRRRPWLRILVLAALAVLIWFYFDGRLPRFGVEEGQKSGAAKDLPRIVQTALPGGASSGERSQEDKGAPRAPSDAELGRRQRLDFLVESGQSDAGAFEDARALATSMRDQTAVDDYRAHAARYLGPDGLLAKAIIRALDAALESEDLDRARRTIALLSTLEAEEALRVRGLASTEVPDESRSAYWTALESRLDGALPIDFGDSRQLVRCEAGSFVLRVTGTAGGYRFHRTSIEDMDPRILRRALLERFSDLPGRQGPPFEELARLYEACGLPLAARLVLRGTLAKN